MGFHLFKNVIKNGFYFFEKDVMDKIFFKENEFAILNDVFCHSWWRHTNIKEFPMKDYYIQKDFLTIEKSTDKFNGVTLPVYDRERTICDCFKYRT